MEMACHWHGKREPHCGRDFRVKCGYFYDGECWDRLRSLHYEVWNWGVGSWLAHRCGVEPHANTASAPGNATSWKLSTWTALGFTDEEATAHGKLTQGSLVIERPVTQGRIVWIKGGDNGTHLPGFNPSPAPCKSTSSCLCVLIFKMGIIRIVPTSWLLWWRLNELI